MRNHEYLFHHILGIPYWVLSRLCAEFYFTGFQGLDRSDLNYRFTDWVVTQGQEAHVLARMEQLLSGVE